MRHFQPRLFAYLLVSFIGCTIVGTLSHEAGHYLVATQYRFKASIHYGYTSFDQVSPAFRQLNDSIQAIRVRHQLIQQRNGHYRLADTGYFPEKFRYQKLLRERQRVLFPINLGGPAQTMLSGTIGLVLLMVNKRRWMRKQTLSPFVWLLVFITLFWLRQLFNLALAVFRVISTSDWPNRMDETKLTLDLHLWPPIISLLSGLVSSVILAFIVLRVVPSSQRVSFILAGLVGGTTGFWLWLIWLGPKLMP